MSVTDADVVQMLMHTMGSDKRHDPEIEAKSRIIYEELWKKYGNADEESPLDKFGWDAINNVLYGRFVDIMMFGSDSRMTSYDSDLMDKVHIRYATELEGKDAPSPYKVGRMSGKRDRMDERIGGRR